MTNPLQSVGNPYRVRASCDDCGRQVWANTRTGLFYSHNLLDSANVCAGSMTPAVRAVDGDAAPVLPGERIKPAGAVDYIAPIHDGGPQESIRDIPSGLPGHGRRR